MTVARKPTLRRTFLLLSLTLGVTGCSQLQHDHIVNQTSPMKAGELFQTNTDRMATLAMRDNLHSLYQLMSKLYKRNPREWRKMGTPSREAAEQAVHHAIEQNKPLPDLGGRKDIEALSYALSPDFTGDRVGAFIYAMGSMLITAHGGKTEFYLTDTFDAQFIHNAARNVERAAWLLSQRRDHEGRPLLLSNEISDDVSNLSYAVEFGKVVARLDLLSDVIEERYRRMGANYAQNLLLINFLPVQ